MTPSSSPKFLRCVCLHLLAANDVVTQNKSARYRIPTDLRHKQCLTSPLRLENVVIGRRLYGRSNGWGSGRKTEALEDLSDCIRWIDRPSIRMRPPQRGQAGMSIENILLAASGRDAYSAWEQEKPEARKMLENAAESPASCARCVSPL